MLCGGLTALSDDRGELIAILCIRFEEQSVDVDGLQEVIIHFFGDILLFSIGVFNIGRDEISSYDSSSFLSEFEELE